MVDLIDTGVLRSGPFWVMSALTGRTVTNDDERRVWADALARLDGPARPLLGGPDLADQPSPPAGDDRSVVTGLTDIAAVLGALDESLVKDYRRLLLMFGLAIATARGPFGRSINAEDGQTLLLCAALIEPADPQASVRLAA